MKGDSLLTKISHGHFASVIFDCDGVILQSNKTKTDAFYLLALPYGESAASELVRYHIANGGISRYNKIRYLLESVLKKEFTEEEYRGLLQQYSNIVREKLIQCPVTDGVTDLLETIPSNTLSCVISGADEKELRDIFSSRKMDRFFKQGIYGSPRTKMEILEDLIKNGDIRLPAVFFGDAPYDYESASAFNIDFVFVSGYTETKNWQNFVSDNNLETIGNFTELFLEAQHSTNHDFGK